MPRRKGHGIPPTKRLKQNTDKSSPVKTKPLEISERGANETAKQMAVENFPLRSEPSQENIPAHSKYLHKKFKKMATTALSPEETFNGSRVKGVLFSVPNKVREEEASSPKTLSHSSEFIIPDRVTENIINNSNDVVNNTNNIINNTNIIFPAAGIGRYVCPYCKLACTKPSVLQKHIRAHTNERPYPCEPCGFAFKTKSNLYKHCRSRAHALKMEEVGEDTTNLPLEEGAESSSEDEDIQGKSSELNYNEEVTNDKEERPAKSIYKPKFHTASIYLQNSSQTIKQEERIDHSSSPPRLQLKMPASTAPQSALSTPSPFTSGSSPSPEFLHRHISKLISENQAIVETMDPFWPKKFLHRTNSKDNNSSSSPLSSSPSPGAESLLPKRYMQRQPSISVDSTSSVQENMNDLDKIGSRQTVHSKLALALLRPQPSTSPRYSNPPSPPSESIDAPLNLTTNSSKIEQQNVNFSNRKRSYSEGIPSPKFPLNKIPNIPLRVNNNNQEHCKYLFNSSDTTISLYSNNVDGKKSSLPNNPQNPEGSIIKDLLLKARAASTGGMPIMSSAGGSYGPVMTDFLTSGKTSNVVHDERSFSPSSQFVCHLCKIPFRNAESLDLHQLYYCKGICDESTRSSLNSPSPHYEAVFLSSPDYPSKTISQSRERKDGSRRDPMLIAPSYPSPGPLLGNTPLVESYHNKVIRNHEFDSSSVKKRKFENESLSLAQELRPISTTTLRSLEELSKCPIRSNALQMFGGEVKILDTAGGETKTMRIEPSNRGTPQTSEMQLLISSHPPTNKNFNKDQNETKESSPQIVVTIAKTGLHSGGGTIVQVPQKITGNDSIQQQISKQSSISTMTSSVTTHILSNSNYADSNKLIIPIIPNIVTSNLSIPGISTPVQLPFIPFTSILSDSNIINPLTSITAYNPLTLPTASLLSAVSKRPPMGIPSPYSGGIVTILHGGKEIPYVPGMPGPHTLLNTNANLSSFTSKPLEIDFKVSPAPESPQGKSVLTIPHQDPKLQKPEKTPLVSSESSKQSSAMTSVLQMKQTLPIPSIQVNNGPEIPPEQMVNKRKLGDEGSILKLSAPNKRNSSPLKSSEPPVSSEENSVLRSEQNINSEKKFLRPSSLPLKPGTFIPKRHTLSTPTNVLSLVSPETPRPRKSYGQLYLNGHAYTYLGLKCSTRVFFCTLNKPQPIYVPLSPEHNKVSMYSNWKVCSEADPNPFGLDPGKAMAYYDSRHRPLEYSLASSKSSEAVTHSTYWNNRTSNKQDKTRPESTNKYEDNQKSESGGTENLPKRVKIFAGGFESNEEYIYVRGRGRGRYVCEECGIRCKKPSMLKKHIRTHTDVRPFTCIYCKFSFKTKGNLTKHMKSKAHYKKCVELGITPVPTVVDDSNVDEGALARQQTLHREQGIEAEETEEEEDDEDEEDDEEDDDDEDEDMDEWKNCQEREAARSLLSLSETLQSATQRQYVNAGLVAMSARPNTYPYSFSLNPSQVVQPQTPTLTSISAHREREKVSQNTGLAREVHGDVKANNQAGASIDESKGNSSEPGVAARYYFPSTQTMPALQDDSSSSSDNHSRESQEDFMDHDELSNDNQSSPAKNASAVPMDLSNKNSDTEVKPNVRVCEAAMLLASLCSTMERLPVTSTSTCTTVPEDSALLQAYLTERAMRDSRMKQHQYKVIPTKTDTVCHINTFQPSPTKVTIESVTSKQTEKIQNLSEPVQEVQESSPTKIDHPKVTVSESENISPNPNMSAAKENALGILAQTSSDARKLAITSSTAPGSPTVSGSGSVLKKLKAEFMPPSSGPSPSYVSQLEDGRSMCIICNKVFTKPSQLRLHVNIHYFERPFRCESCAVSFRTKGHLQKHQRSVSHLNKVSMNSTFGAPTTSNPRPFKCDDCKIAFRIHGHLAKHLRSKMHIMKLECLGKLPFGTYAEMERSGINMNDIDTTDCENSLESLQMLAHKLYEKDPSKLSQWDPNEMMPQINQNLSSGDTTSEDEDPGIACPSPPTPISSTSREQFIHKTLIVSPVQRLPAPSVQKASLQRIEPLKYVNLSNTPVESNYKSSKHKSPVSNLVVLTNANDLVGHAQVSKTEMVRSNHDTSKTVAVSESEENRVEDRLSLTVNSELNSDVVIRIGNRNNIIESRTESVDNQNETSDIECYVTRGND